MCCFPVLSLKKSFFHNLLHFSAIFDHFESHCSKVIHKNLKFRINKKKQCAFCGFSKRNQFPLQNVASRVHTEKTPDKFGKILISIIIIPNFVILAMYFFSKYVRRDGNANDEPWHMKMIAS